MCSSQLMTHCGHVPIISTGFVCRANLLLRSNTQHISCGHIYTQTHKSITLQKHSHRDTLTSAANEQPDDFIGAGWMRLFYVHFIHT